MAACNDKHYRDMLYAYELGMLDDDQTQEFEIHLLTCSYCNNRAQKFNSVSQILRHDPDVRTTMARLDTTEDIPKESTSTAKRSWRTLLPTTLAAAAIIVFLILKPWQITIESTDYAVAVENRLLVTHFENLADPDDSTHLGGILSNLLITDLSESAYIQVISNQRLSDLYVSIGSDQSNISTESFLQKATRKTQARWSLTGSIVQTDPTLAVTVEIIDNTSGETIASIREVASENNDYFDLVDKLTIEIRKHLTLPKGAELEPDPLVADVTTHSQKAYQHYLAGLNLRSKLFRSEAIDQFELALKYDSTFAMAYYYLSVLKSRSYIEQATMYAAKASHREQLYIQSRQAAIDEDKSKATQLLQDLISRYPQEKDAHFLLGTYYWNLAEFAEASEAFQEAVRIDSTFRSAYNQLAYLFAEMRNYDSSLWAINKYIAIAPDEPNPYDTRGDLYAYSGNLEASVASYLKALSIKPDFYSSLAKAGHMYVFMREYQKADSCYLALPASKSNAWKSTIAIYRLFIPLHQGRFQDALQIQSNDIREDREIENINALTQRLRLKALIHANLGDLDSALSVTEQLLEISENNAIFWNLKVCRLADAGRIDEAAILTDKLKNQLESTGSSMVGYWYAAGYIERARGNNAAAVEFFQKFVDNEGIIPCFTAHFMLGRSLLDAGRLSEAVSELQWQMSFYEVWRLYWGGLNVKMHYYLGLAYERSNWNDKAIEEYETFLDIWKNADSGIVEIGDATERLRRLKNQI